MRRHAVEDLSPFLAEECRLYVLLARAAPVGAILRRGPGLWWRLSFWDTRRDEIEGGQWFRGKLYPEQCDLSPNGKLFLYFGGKYRGSDMENGYGLTYTAASRPPYLTALALWPNKGGVWGGGGVFLDDQTVVLHQSTRCHRDHPRGPLKVVGYSSVDPQHRFTPCFRNGWSGIVTPPQTKHFSAWRKTAGAILERAVAADEYRTFFPKRKGARYTLYRPSEESLASFHAQWADFDLNGRLVAAAGGRVFQGEIARKRGPLVWSEITSLASERFVPLVAPDWAQHW